jgi:hypothetical protein
MIVWLRYTRSLRNSDRIVAIRRSSGRRRSPARENYHARMDAAVEQPRRSEVTSGSHRERVGSPGQDDTLYR